MPEKSLNVRGVEWRYATAGRGRQTILLLHGAVGGAETTARLAEGFADEYRTVAPTIADVPTLAAACDALSAILDREHVGRAVVFGGSFGGMLAQDFLKRRPQQVEHLVLLGASLPNREAGARARRMLKFLRLLPFPLTRALLKLEASKALDAPAPPEVAARVAEFRQRLDEYFDRGLTRAALLSRLSLSVDFNSREPHAPNDLDAWPGRVLLVESTDDPAAPAEERRRLREAYPRALVCAFAGAGEMIPLLRLEELVGVVKAFLKEDYSSPSDIIAECAVEEEHEHALRPEEECEAKN
ncbi:MAG TPA: alpha/beta hydrolase [Pyrinomonadaceae bacterium]|jgi:pimeloyl-ACP methyl ester carboxylesterase|nr:alpha/beta hydrolase [Pyrinomonadaceae bacterium]